MIDYLKKIEDEDLSLLIIKDNKILYSSSEKGMKPLIEAVHWVGLKRLAKSTVVDRVTGRAAALIISYFMAKEVFTYLLSDTAADVLEYHGVKYSYIERVHSIKNVKGKDLCPFEKMTLEIKEPKKGYELIMHSLEKNNSIE